MACRALWNTTSDESFHSHVLSEIDFMYSTKESGNKNVECTFYNGKFSKDQRKQIWITCFSCSVLENPNFTEAENAEYI